MTLLTPAAAVLAALLVVPALALLYFLKLRRRPLRVSSTLLWQRAVHDLQVNVPFAWIRPNWLLMLQALALACLAVAAGRPALDSPGGAPRRIVVAIDRSASMSATDTDFGSGNRDSTRLDRAKARARELVGNTLERGQRGAQVMVASFAGSVQPHSGFSADKGLLTEAIDQITPTDQPADGAALADWLRTFPVSTDEAEQTSVVVVTDGGTMALATGRQPDPIDVPLQVVLVGPPPATRAEDLPDNIGIVTFSARREYDDPGTVRVFARLSNSAGQARSVPMVLSLDGAIVGGAAGTIEVPGATLADGIAKPGQATASFKVESTSGGVVQLNITRRDVLADDNTAWLVLPRVAQPRVLVVAPGAGGSEADRFLISLLRELCPGSVRIIDADQYSQSIAALGPLPAGKPEAPIGADLVVFDRIEPAVLPACASLSVGAGLPPMGISIRRTPVPSTPGGFLSWQRDHPIMRSVSLDTIVLAASPAIVGPGTDTKDPIITTLATGATGPLISLLQEPGAGSPRLVIAFPLAQSTWSTHVSFPVFIAGALDYLTLRAETASGKQVSTTQAVRSMARAGEKRLRLIGNQGPVLSVDVPSLKPGEAPVETPVLLGVVERAGLYQIEGASDSDRVLAVNMCDAGESGLVSTGSLPQWLARARGGRNAIIESGGPREVWHWFVLASVLLLTVEWVLYGWRMRG